MEGAAEIEEDLPRMDIPFYQIDAFTERRFCGNPAAVCPLETWLDDELLQAIARENNLSETAFFVPDGDAYRIRWFTPLAEVDLCGHATLASAFVLFNQGLDASDRVRFHSRSGDLEVQREGGLLVLDFPAQPPAPCRPHASLAAALGKKPLEILASADYLVVYASEQEVAVLAPDMDGLKQVDLRGVIVTAPGDDADFVSRFFAPKYGVPEDPVTGSAHCALVPYWSGRLGKKQMHARQISARGGELFVTDRGDRVLIGGRAVQVIEGRLTL